MEAVCHHLVRFYLVLLCFLFTSVTVAQSVTSISIDDPDAIEPAVLDTQDLFGMDIAIEGNTAIVSSRRFLFFFNQQNDGRWELQSTLDTDLGNWFSELELHGDTLVVSKRNHTAVYRKLSSGSWQLESDTLPISRFVEFDGVRLMLGDYVPGTGTPAFTSIYARNSDGSWSREFHITGRTGKMDIEGEYAAISAEGNTYIYNRNSSTGQWDEAGVLSIQDYPSGDVSLYDGQLLIGYEGQGADNGFAYLYSRIAGGRWQLEDVFRGRVDASPGQDVYQGSIGDRFGSRVELSENKVVIGARWGHYAALSGLIYIFQPLDADEWQESHVLLSLYGNDGFPEGIAYTDQSLLAGGIYTGAESGVVYAYDISQTLTSNCIDTDGDGYGWNGVGTCIPDVIDDSCDYSTSHLYDGWGWDPVNFESCPPRDQDDSEDDCDYSSADLYDGWGWNPVTLQSCAPLTGDEPQGDCDYTDASMHNGWGWNPVTLESCASR